MSNLRLKRFAPLTGIAFAVLSVVGTRPISSLGRGAMGVPHRPAVDNIVAAFSENTNLDTGAYLAALATSRPVGFFCRVSPWCGWW